MKGFIEVKEDSYEDTIEHLYRLKALACKMIKKLSESSEIYHDDEEIMNYKYRGGRYHY